jgi:hypothetical protein
VCGIPTAIFGWAPEFFARTIPPPEISGAQLTKHICTHRSPSRRICHLFEESSGPLDIHSSDDFIRECASNRSPCLLSCACARLLRPRHASSLLTARPPRVACILSSLLLLLHTTLLTVPAPAPRIAHGQPTDPPSAVYLPLFRERCGGRSFERSRVRSVQGWVVRTGRVSANHLSKPLQMRDVRRVQHYC